jgi:hypothetical protein
MLKLPKINLGNLYDSTVGKVTHKFVELTPYAPTTILVTGGDSLGEGPLPPIEDIQEGVMKGVGGILILGALYLALKR